MNDHIKPRHRLPTLLAALAAAGVGLTAASCSSHSGGTGSPAAAGPTTASVAAPAEASTAAPTTATGPQAPGADGPAGDLAGVTSHPPAGPGAVSSAAARPGPASSAPSAPSSPAGPGPGAPSSRPAPPAPPPIPAPSLPNAAVADWQPMGGLVAMTVPEGRDIGISECASVHGAAAWHEQGYVSAQHTPAQEDVFGFGDPQSATRAFQSITASLDGCAQTTRDAQRRGGAPLDATVVTTATAQQAQAWSRKWTGVAGQSAAGPQINHYYLVQRGATVILAGFSEFGAHPPTPYDTAGDPAVLTMLTANAGS
ncbi:hypothetical protein [Catenulispora subtropica]|uniref:PknH-like extracellular domain-containing protein n=1 Tax=Catenulispora subtropica TaxID=450798 RepID=A0ABP5CL03_9ACTN